MAKGTDPDIIQSVLQMVLEVEPLFGLQKAEMIEQRARREWAGINIVIARRAPELRKLRAKVRAEIGFKSAIELHQECGVSRSTIYRWIRK
ncbi:MAG: hypothetical protein WC236_00080 [Gallionellaceae bacterium]|jgi:DNA invertase Pin-like site-specific DNA recombinase